MATTEVVQSQAALDSLLALDPSLYQPVNQLLEHLPAYLETHPHRVHVDAHGVHVYHHPDPDLEIAYELDRETGRITCLAVDAPLPRKIAFVSYCHKNDKLRKEFADYMISLLDQGRVQFWVDRELQAADDWETELYRALNTAEAAVILVTQDYLASEYIRTRELPVLRDRWETKSVVVYWVPMEPSTYEDTWLGKLQALGGSSKPLSLLPKAKRQAKLVEISRELKTRLIG